MKIIILHKNNVWTMSLLQGLKHFDEILQEADGIILSRGNLGIDLPPEKVRGQRAYIYCSKHGLQRLQKYKPNIYFSGPITQENENFREIHTEILLCWPPC